MEPLQVLCGLVWALCALAAVYGAYRLCTLRATDPRPPPLGAEGCTTYVPPPMRGGVQVRVLQ